MRTSDGGDHWEEVKTEAASWSLAAVCFRDLKNGWIVGFAGQILRSRDGGATWTAVASPVKSWLTSITFDSAGRGWIAYDDGLLLSRDGGETWKAVPIPGRYFLARLIRRSDSLWALGQSAILRQTGAGMDWKKIESLAPGGSAAAIGRNAVLSTK